MKRSTIHITLLAGALVWCSLIVLPPFVAPIEGAKPAISAQLYKFFSPICHQYESRSLHLFDYKFGVCARCFGIYAGFFVGILLAFVRPRDLKLHAVSIWIIAVVPMLVDVLLDIVGLHSSTLTTRFISGSFFGVVAATVLTPIAINAILEFISPTLTNQGVLHEPEA